MGTPLKFRPLASPIYFTSGVSYQANAIDNDYGDTSTYAYSSTVGTSSSKATRAILYNGCADSSIVSRVQNGETVSALRIYVKARKYGSSTPYVKNLSGALVWNATSQAVGDYTIIQNSRNFVDSMTTTTTPYSLEFNSDAIDYINTHRSEFGTKLGIRIFGAYFRLYDLYYEIEFQDRGTILYDSYFNFKKWKNAGIGSGSNASVSNITDIGFTVKGNANDSFTNYSPVYKMTAGTYTIAVDSTGGSSREVFVFCSTDGSYNYDASKLQPSYSPSFNFTVWSTHPYIFHRCDVNTSGETITYSNFRVVPSNDSFRLNTVTASQRVNDSGSWGTMPTPTRTGYDFVGWYDTPATSGGTKYTSSSAFPTSDIILWSRWTIKTYKITTSAGTGGTITSTKTVNYGSNQSITATANTGYVIDTLTVDGTTISAATGKDTYTYNFNNVTSAHTVSVTYKLTAQPPEFTSVSMLYMEHQITQNHKVPAGQGFRISVRLQ